MASFDQIVDGVWKKALADVSYRNALTANPVTELKKAGISDVPADLKFEVKGGKLTFTTSDQLALGQLNSRVTKSK